MNKKQDSKNQNDTDETKYIYRPYITLKNGQILWAWQRGKKAFKIPVS